MNHERLMQTWLSKQTFLSREYNDFYEVIRLIISLWAQEIVSHECRNLLLFNQQQSIGGMKGRRKGGRKSCDCSSLAQNGSAATSSLILSDQFGPAMRWPGKLRRRLCIYKVDSRVTASTNQTSCIGGFIPPRK